MTAGYSVLGGPAPERGREASTSPSPRQLIVFEIGLRFLTDHLEGDVYFKVHRPGHNLDRCRTQFKMVRVLEERDDRFQEIAERATAAAVAAGPRP